MTYVLISYHVKGMFIIREEHALLFIIKLRGLGHTKILKFRDLLYSHVTFLYPLTCTFLRSRSSYLGTF